MTTPAPQPIEPGNPSAAPEPEAQSRNYLRYIGNAIPWYVRLGWVGFWILCIWYVLTWLIPALKVETATPP